MNVDAPDAATPNDDPDAFASLCFPGPFRCDGTRAIPCEAQNAQKVQDCAEQNQVCSPSLGCVECVPGKTSCIDGQATWCRDDGTLAHFTCDPAQGLTCDPQGCLGACALNELKDSYIGCDYYPTVTLNPVWSGFSFAIAVSNTSAEPTDITITRGAEVITQSTVAANALRTFELPWVAELKGGDIACVTPPAPGKTRLVREGAYRVRSNRPVTVYQFSPLQYRLDPIPQGCPIIDGAKDDCAPLDEPPPNGQCLSYSNDASLLLPANTLTGSYTALAWPTQGRVSEITGSGFLAITATEDGTTVELRGQTAIEPGAGLSEDGRGSVQLNRGDVLEVVASQNSDLSGTRIRADKAVQVISGQSCAYVPTLSVDNCDHIEEALFPEDTLGADYIVTTPLVITPPDVPEKVPFVLRVVALLDGSEVSFDPPVSAPVTLNAGELVSIELSKETATNIHVKSNRAVQIATYMVGQKAIPEAGIIGDPSMSLAVPIEQYRESYLFTASTTYDLNFASIIAKRGATVRIDGEIVLPSEFSQVGASEFGVAQVLLSQDSSVHRLESDQEVGLTVYGYGWYTSYMYPGGADLDRITIPAIL